MKLIPGILTLALFSGVTAYAQTIADIARQERARRQALSITSITNETLKVEPKVVAGDATQEGDDGDAAAPSAQNPAAPDAATDSPAADAPARDEQWWRSEFSKARTDVRRAQDAITVGELELNKANMEYLTRSFDPDGRGRAAVAEATARIENARKELAAAREKITQLEEELRRAGAPPGWAR